MNAAELPAVPRPHVARPALVAQVLAHRVTLLRAPAGYGKTALLAEVLRADWGAAQGSARLSGDTGSVYVDATSGIDRVQAAFERLTLQPPEATRILAIDRIETLAGDAAAWSGLDRCVAGAPPTCRLILAGRAVPPLPALTRLRLTGDLLVVGAGEMRFTDEECARLLELLGRADQGELALADGWPAALRLLALGTAGGPGSDSSARESGAAERISAAAEVMAYVSREVAPAAQEDVRLLSDLSVIADWTPDALDQLLERSDGRQLLDAWADVLPVDRHGRVHPLVRRHFRSLLDRDPVRRRRLERRAALLAAGREEWSPALRHALAAGDVGLAAPLLRRAVEAELAAGRLADVEAILSSTPGSVLEAVPDLLLAAGESLRREGRSRQAVRWLQTAAVGFAREGATGGLLRALCRLALAHADLGQWNEAEAAVAQVESELATTAGRDRAEALQTLALHALRVGRHAAAAERLQEAAQLYRSEGEAAAAAESLLRLGEDALVGLGLLDEALSALRACQALVGGATACGAALAEAQILLALGRTREAGAVLAAAEPHGAEQRALLRVLRARAALAAGDPDCAKAVLATGHPEGESPGRTADSEGARPSAKPDLAGVRPDRTADPARLSDAIPPPELRGQVLLLEGWLAHAEGDPGRALECGRMAVRAAVEGARPSPLLRLGSERLLAEVQARMSPAPAPGLDVACLGAFRMRAGGREVPLTHWGRAQVRTALQFLLLQPGFAAPRELLLETLWPDEDPARSRARLRVVLNRLRQALQALGGGLEASWDSVRLPRGAVARLDLLEFRRHLEAARECARTAPEACLAHCRNGRSLYRGDLLQDAYWPGVEAHRRQARRELLELLSLWRGAAERLGRTEEALAVLEEIVALEPGEEAAVRSLMAMLIHSGRRGEAAARYRALARWLKEELGLDPAPETRALFRQALE
ncbi:BTAD domain-containing putative transcriptional regulator [Symbiobacterium terraclitae]|uniref:BTAD domain-containing putative transcriptional regulator n=1 Tax=Symbiobacterium terraclitae TaxID=557451 RepID=UPI0035B56AAC